MSNEKTNALDKLRAHLKEAGIISGGEKYKSSEKEHLDFIMNQKIESKKLSSYPPFNPEKVVSEPTPEEKERAELLEKIPY